MTRVDVAGSGYDGASEALIAVNHDAAIYYENLTADLSGYGAMAGDDSTSDDFAREYDANAQLAVDALRDLVDAAGNLGVTTALSIENHRRANGGSVYGGPAVVYDGSQSLVDAGEVDVPAFSLPSSEGGDSSGTPEFWDMIVDHLQGFAWPNADVDKLRQAAASWRSAQSGIGGLTTSCDIAIDQLGGQRSPEIPLATGATRELRTGATDLGVVCGDIAQACDDYADEVEHHRETIKDILEDLAIEIGATAAIGVVTSFFTFGGGGAVAAGVAATRIASAANRVRIALQALKTAARLKAVATLAAVGTKVKAIGPVLKRLANRVRHSFKPPKKPKKPPNARNVADIGRTVSRQKQARHVKDTPEWRARGQGGYLEDPADAQRVLDAVHSGQAKIVGYDRHGNPVVRYDDVTGYNNNPAAGYVDQPTNIFIIKGTNSPSVVPTSPTKG